MSAEGLATNGPRDGVEVWTVCLDCRRPVKLLGTEWHHEHPAGHEAAPDTGQRPKIEDGGYGHVYALVDLVRDRSQR
jgi:hypothetical protein